MHSDTEYLRSIAEEIAVRQNPDNINEPKADHRLLLEARKLEKAITADLRAFDNDTQRDTFHNDILGKIVDVCDLLFEVNREITPNVKVIIDLLAAIRKVLPRAISPRLPLPKAFVHNQQNIYRSLWKTFEEGFLHHEIDKELIEIAAVPFKRFIDGSEKLFWGDFTWLKGYTAKLNALDFDHGLQQ